MIKAEKKRSLPASPDMRLSFEGHIQWLTEEEHNLTFEIRRKIKNQPELIAKSGIVQSATCIEIVTAANLVAELPELGSLDRKPIAVFVKINDRAACRAVSRNVAPKNICSKPRFLLLLYL